MTVYIDDIVDWGKPAEGKDTKNANATTYPRCHLWADSEAELNDFAKTLHLPLGWKQRGGMDRKFIHFDLSPDWRRRALRNGAKETTLRDYLREHRKDHHAEP